MTNTCGNSCGTTFTNTCVQPNVCVSNGNGLGNYAFVLVLFILLVICGAAYIF